jgi:hypothetical protein
MNNNQHDALFIFSLLSYHISTCFGRISSPSSGGRMYIYVTNGTCYTSELTAIGPGRAERITIHLLLTCVTEISQHAKIWVKIGINNII